MKEFIDKIKEVNQLLYNIYHKGRDFWGDEWSDTSFYENGVAMAHLYILKETGKKYLDFAKYDFYWDNLRENLEYKEVESQGYALRMKQYFDKYATKIRKADYQKLMNSVFVSDLLADEYISQEEADSFCKLFVEVHDKAYKDAIRAYKIILDVLNPEQIEIESKTPAMDFMFHGKNKLRKRFISFFCAKHDRLKLTATDAVQILLMEVGKDRFDALNKNGLTAKHLWGDLRAVGVIEHNISDRTLNKAAEGKFPKPDVIDAWRAFNK